MKNMDIAKENLKHYNLKEELPSNYYDCVEKTIEKVFDILGDNILSITLGGSAGKKDIHSGWSDIDLFFIINEYEMEKIIEFNEKCNEQDSIHVGTSFYTLKEVEKNIVSYKTKVMIYEKYKYNLNPTLYGKDYYIPVTYETIRSNDIHNFPSIYQDYKKMIMELKSDKVKPSRTHIKKMLLLLKCILNFHNIFSFGYEEVLLKFTTLCREFHFSLTKKRGIDIIALIDDFDNLELYKDEIVEFSDEIFNFIDKFC
ncbi:MAG: nucleotidyltransferase domain-containing protein [Bacilli bacterium]